MERYDIIRALGIEVLPAASLSTNAAMVRGEMIALVRTDLDAQEHEEAFDYLLGRAIEASSRARQ